MGGVEGAWGGWLREERGAKWEGGGAGAEGWLARGVGWALDWSSLLVEAAYWLLP